MFVPQPITVETRDINAKQETIDKLINDPVENMNFVIEQKNRLVKSLSEEELNDPLIHAKLAYLDHTIERFKTELSRMTNICEQATKSIKEVAEKTNNVMS